MIATGLRWPEAAGLRVKNVDPLACTLRVEQTRHELSGGSPLVVGPPKTKHSRRTVTYPPEVAELVVPLVSMRHRDAVSKLLSMVDFSAVAGESVGELSGTTGNSEEELAAQRTA